MKKCLAFILAIVSTASLFAINEGNIPCTGVKGLNGLSFEYYWRNYSGQMMKVQDSNFFAFRATTSSSICSIETYKDGSTIIDLDEISVSAGNVYPGYNNVFSITFRGTMGPFGTGRPSYRAEASSDPDFDACDYNTPSQCYTPDQYDFTTILNGQIPSGFYAPWLRTTEVKINSPFNASNEAYLLFGYFNHIERYVQIPYLINGQVYWSWIWIDGEDWADSYTEFNFYIMQSPYEAAKSMSAMEEEALLSKAVNDEKKSLLSKELSEANAKESLSNTKTLNNIDKQIKELFATTNSNKYEDSTILNALTNEFGNIIGIKIEAVSPKSKNISKSVFSGKVIKEIDSLLVEDIGNIEEIIKYVYENTINSVQLIDNNMSAKTYSVQ